MDLKIKVRLLEGKKRINRPKDKAISKLDKTPAKATKGIPVLGFLKLYGLKGTGFAQPKINPAFVIIKRNGNKIEPNISICGKGFKVSLPSSLAVESPK